MGDHPRERLRRRVAALGQGFDPVVHAVVVQMQVRIGPERHPRALGMPLAAPVLPGQPAAGERTESLVAEPVLGAERKYAVLVPPLEQGVRVLDERRASRRQRPLELRRREITYAVTPNGPLL